MTKTADVHTSVQRFYSERITEDQGCCTPDVATQQVGTLSVPTFGCGTPTDFADLQVGETVLDLGSGAGLDCFRAAAAVGPTGRVVGVDMTPAMLGCSRAGAARLGLTNVDFFEGLIEALPLPPNSIDVALSNCVVNLSPAKEDVFAEVYRVLKPGGRVAFSDTVRAGPAQSVTETGWCACEDGAEDVATYRRRLVEAGFTNVTIDGETAFGGVHSARVRATKPVLRAASAADLAAARALLSRLGLPLAGLEQTRVWVLEENGAWVGIVGYEPYGEAALLRSLAVAPERRGEGLARTLLAHTFAVLREQNFRVAYGLTTTIPDLLLKLGFTETSRGALPKALDSSAQLQGAHACPGSARVFRKDIKDSA